MLLTEANHQRTWVQQNGTWSHAPSDRYRRQDRDYQQHLPPQSHGNPRPHEAGWGSKRGTAHDK